jgi:hypothetical protein
MSSVLILVEDLDEDRDRVPPRVFVVDQREVTLNQHSIMRDLQGDGSPVIKQDDDTLYEILGLLREHPHPCPWKSFREIGMQEMGKNKQEITFFYFISYKAG